MQQAGAAFAMPTKLPPSGARRLACRGWEGESCRQGLAAASRAGGVPSAPWLEARAPFRLSTVSTLLSLSALAPASEACYAQPCALSPASEARHASRVALRLSASRVRRLGRGSRRGLDRRSSAARVPGSGLHGSQTSWREARSYAFVHVDWPRMAKPCLGWHTAAYHAIR